MTSPPDPTGPAWQEATSPPSLRYDGAHLWRINLRCAPAELIALGEMLCDEERRRAARFYRPELQQRFTAGRGLLRTILSKYLGAPPDTLKFTYNSYGKPALSGAAAGGLEFNLSHSADIAVLGVCRGRSIGVDVETIRSQVKCEELAKRFFSPREVDVLQNLPAPQRRKAFFHAWTRKESYIKAVGRGLAVPLDSFDVSLAPGEPARLLWVKDDAGAADRWRMTSVDLGSDSVAAMIVAQPFVHIWYGVWPDPAAASL